jgi:RNA recognition motif-containing protein
VARVLSTNVSSLAKSYARSVGNIDTSQEEQLVQDVSKSYSEARLSGVQIIDHYYDPPTKTMFALAILDFEQFKELTEAARELPKALREHILKNADEAFKELDAQKPKEP